MLRTCCASSPTHRFANLIFSRHTFLTPIILASNGGDMMEGLMHEIGVLMGGLACGAGFMIIALFITGIIH